MSIKPYIVNRDKNGFWTHPSLPDFGEDIMDYTPWLDKNNITVKWYYLEDCNNESIVTKYFEDNDTTAINEWQPSCDDTGSFLLSIHDTEDGPIAVFAIPNSNY